jgi:hypothetical protein
MSYTGQKNVRQEKCLAVETSWRGNVWASQWQGNSLRRKCEVKNLSMKWSFHHWNRIQPDAQWWQYF